MELHYGAELKSPTGLGELLHCKIVDLAGGRWPVTVHLYGTNKVVIQGVPGKLPEADFNRTVRFLENVVRECTREEQNSLRLNRASSICELLRSLDNDDEPRRIATVLLSETVVELLLNERLSSNGLLGNDLKRAGVPKKVEALLRRFGRIYRSPDVNTLYGLRCGIAHEGNAVSKDDAEWARGLTLDLIQKKW